MLMYPVRLVNHTGWARNYILMLDTRSAKAKLTIISPIVLLEAIGYVDKVKKIELVMLDKNDLISNSGKQSVEVYKLNPFIELKRYNVYSLKVLHEYLTKIKHSTIEELLDAAFNEYVMTNNKDMPSGAFIWRRGKGYSWALLVKEVSVDETLDAIDEFMAVFIDLLQG